MQSFEPGAVENPDLLPDDASAWKPARAPGTVASALRAAGEWSVGTERGFDRHDWWYRCRFEAEAQARRRMATLEIGGLASVGDVWLNGAHLLHSENMFHEHAIDVSDRLRDKNELVIRFSSLRKLLAQKRPRPRYRTALVAEQQLRWFRTTLAGRMPGWTPPIETVGPWRPIALREHDVLSFEDPNLRVRVDGSSGIVTLDVRARTLSDAPIEATLHVGDAHVRLAGRKIEDRLFALHGEVRLEHVALWWPRSHGSQPLYGASIHARVSGSEVVASLGPIGFRTIEADTRDGGFAISVNGVPIFCRGACWTPLDVARLDADADAYRAALDQVADAGMNMVRVLGTMFYEHDAFYEACDERGIMVWQDCAFANFDYPADDAAFSSSVTREVSQFLSRVQSRPSLAVLCGNSEVAQQAAMLGMSRELWSNAIFDKTIPSIARELRPDVAYVPSSPSGGTLPFHVGQGVSHYYGIGAYMRPLEDARRAGVRFTSECLGFSNVPADTTIELVLTGRESPFVGPAWKSRVPRDGGASWDFEDVRDHYLALLFSVDPASLRRTDMPRYLALSRVVTGEVIANVLGEWRRGGSTCRGALLWFLRDLWPGAGWGIIDSTGTPKAPYYYVRRALQRVSLAMTDEGLDGLALHAINDTAEAISADLEIALYQHASTCVARGSQSITIAPRSTFTIGSDAMLEHFLDVTYTYKFGAHGRDVVVGTLRPRDDSAPASSSFHFPLGHAFACKEDIGLEARAKKNDDGTYALTVRTRSFAQAVAIDAPGHRPDDDFFHLAPGGERTVMLRSASPGSELRGSVQALNCLVSSKIVNDAGDRTP
ncbi:MAG: glycosyl hydrolase 2 galactose-binding domain-containing protein, partial [Polyangiaceae bacterium]